MVKKIRKKIWPMQRDKKGELIPVEAKEKTDDISQETNQEIFQEFKKESKETKEKSLEFEKDTFKIDSNGWKEIEKGGRKVKINNTGDVTEYLDGTAKGEQIFIDYDKFINYVAEAKKCSREEVEKKYLMTMDEYKQKMTAIDEAGTYKKFYDKEVKDHLAGYRNSTHKEFNNVGSDSHFWLVDGSNANIHRFNQWSCYSDCRSYGFSGRLLKN